MGRFDAVPSSGQSQVASVKSVLSPQTTKKYTAQEMREVYTDAQPRSSPYFSPPNTEGNSLADPQVYRTFSIFLLGLCMFVWGDLWLDHLGYYPLMKLKLHPTSRSFQHSFWQKPIQWKHYIYIYIFGLIPSWGYIHRLWDQEWLAQ